MFERLVVSAQALQNEPEEEMGLGERAVDGERPAQDRFGRVHIAFLNLRARDVHPPIGISRIDPRHFIKCGCRALEIALQQQANPVIVPSLPH